MAERAHPSGDGLETRLEFETLISDLSSRFINLPPGEVDRESEDSLRLVCELLGIDLAVLWQWSAAVPDVIAVTHVHTQEDPQVPEEMRQEHFPWYRQQMLAGHTIAVSSLEAPPAEAAVDRETCRLLGVKSNLCLPLSRGDATRTVEKGVQIMKRILSIACLVLLAGPPAVLAQAPAATPPASPPAAAQPSGQKSLAATLEVYAFPQKGQAPTQQSQDEAACYQWAVQNTGKDPFDLQKQAQQQAQQSADAKDQVQGSSKGSGARGAVRGAAAGAVVGEVASNDAGKGAAYGAAAGAVVARRRGKKAEAEAAKQIEQQSQAQQAATAEEITKFKKAFGACLEGKGYLVKF